jgi:hypothetical protein
MSLLNRLRSLAQEHRHISKWDKDYLSGFSQLGEQDLREAVIELGYEGELDLYWSLITGSGSDLKKEEIYISKSRLHEMIFFAEEEKKLHDLLDEVYSRDSIDISLLDSLASRSPERSHQSLGQLSGLFLLEVGTHDLLYQIHMMGNVHAMVEPSILKNLELVGLSAQLSEVDFVPAEVKKIRDVISRLPPDFIEYFPKWFKSDPESQNDSSTYISWLRKSMVKHEQKSRTLSDLAPMVSPLDTRRNIARSMSYHLDKYIQDSDLGDSIQVVDLGPYDGYFMAHFNRTASVYDIDIDIAGIELNPTASKNTYKNLRKQNTIHEDSGANILEYYQPGSVDFISANGVCNFGVMPYSDAVDVLLNAQRALKIGGMMVISSGYSPPFFSREEFESIGFDVVGTTIPPFLYPNENDLGMNIANEFYVLRKIDEISDDYQLNLSRAAESSMEILDHINSL